MKKTIAILALQGAFFEHEQMLQSLGAETMLIRYLPDWEAFLAKTDGGRHAGLVIPGGESTAMLRIMRDENLLLPLRQAIASGMPVFGTCAGMILLAARVDNDDRERLATMDITVRRNAYGRQLGSFYTEASFEGITTGQETVPMTFIRAPYITHVGSEAEALAVVDGNIVAARQGKQLVCSFHPELNDDTRIHSLFLSMID
ncbi:MAG: pyridoxal 5'-phosphate synthase glutaminase subunit PdxT [Prevotella sp.]